MHASGFRKTKRTKRLTGFKFIAQGSKLPSTHFSPLPAICRRIGHSTRTPTTGHLAGSSGAYEGDLVFFLLSAQLFFIASDKRLRSAGVRPRRGVRGRSPSRGAA